MNVPYMINKTVLTNALNNDVCVEKVGGNRFNLVLIASMRARELVRGHKPLVNTPNGPIVTSLQEIEAGLITADYLKRIR
jgi:DNA-directed RNA polymerase subunit omega